MGGSSSTGITLITGTREPYSWLKSSIELRTFLRLCPRVVLERYVVVMSIDSGPLVLSERDLAGGWRSEGGIAYSPKIASLEAFPSESHAELCEGFDELYVFDSPPPPLGQAVRGNIFEARLVPGELHGFVNYYAFDLSKEDFSSMFWEQMDWVKPTSYLADGSDHLTFVTRDRRLFDDVMAALNRSQT